MSKFKIGDKVEILPRGEYAGLYWSPEMCGLVGRIGTVGSETGSGASSAGVLVPGLGQWYFEEHQLKLIESAKPKAPDPAPEMTSAQHLAEVLETNKRLTTANAELHTKVLALTTRISKLEFAIREANKAL